MENVSPGSKHFDINFPYHISFIIFRYHILTSYFDIIFWYHILTSYFDIIFWHHILTSYFEIIFWLHILTSYFDIIFWHHILTSYFDIIFWRHISISYFLIIWGSLCNYRHLGPRRVLKGGSDLQSDPPFPADWLDPVQNNGRLIFAVIYNVFGTFSRKMITIFEVAALGALLAPRWPQMRFGSPLDLNLEASWSTSWRQDRPSETQDGPSETQMANFASFSET